MICSWFGRTISHVGIEIGSKLGFGAAVGNIVTLDESLMQPRLNVSEGFISVKRCGVGFKKKYSINNDVDQQSNTDQDLCQQ